jgi:hypothetical protein
VRERERERERERLKENKKTAKSVYEIVERKKESFVINFHRLRNAVKINLRAIH